MLQQWKKRGGRNSDSFSATFGDSRIEKKHSTTIQARTQSNCNLIYQQSKKKKKFRICFTNIRLNMIRGRQEVFVSTQVFRETAEKKWGKNATNDIRFWMFVVCKSLRCTPVLTYIQSWYPYYRLSLFLCLFMFSLAIQNLLNAFSILVFFFRSFIHYENGLLISTNHLGYMLDLRCSWLANTPLSFRNKPFAAYVSCLLLRLRLSRREEASDIVTIGWVNGSCVSLSLRFDWKTKIEKRKWDFFSAVFFF